MVWYKIHSTIILPDLDSTININTVFIYIFIYMQKTKTLLASGVHVAGSLFFGVKFCILWLVLLSVFLYCNARPSSKRAWRYQ